MRAQHVSVRRGVYHDSVTLLRITQTAASSPGITAAQVAMATPLNTELAAGLGFSIPDGTGPNDLLITISGTDDAAVETAMTSVDTALTERHRPVSSGVGTVAAPRTVRTAAGAHPEAPIVLLSVPGPAVLGEALDAIDAGRHLMIFSDNVPIADEITIKDAATAKGLLVMGPDCGTAVIGGIGFGFANVLRGNDSGPRVGVVAASGTGAQQLTCLLDDAGVTVSQVLGLGGRDLSAAVAGRSALAALRMLDDDAATDHIVLISKPPHPATAAAVRAVAQTLGTPVTMILIGPGLPDITAGAEQVLAALGLPTPDWPTWEPPVAATERPPANRCTTRAVFRRDPGRRGDRGGRPKPGRHPTRTSRFGRASRISPGSATRSSTSATTRSPPGGRIR